MLSQDYLIYLVALILISTGNYWVGKRDVMYPGFIYSFMWTIVFGAYVFSPIEINTVGTSTCLLLVFGALAFSFGSYLGKFVPITWRAVQVDLPCQRRTKYLLFFYCLAVLPLFYQDVMSISKYGFTSLTDIRNLIVAAATAGEKVYSSIITGSIIAVAIGSTFVAFIEHSKGSRFIYYSVVLALTYCILNTGRTSLMTLIFGLTAIHLIKKRKPLRFGQAMRTLGLPAVLIVVSMIGYMFMTHNTVEGDMMSLAFDYFFLYVIGGIPALDLIIKTGNLTAPHHTFQFFTQLSNSMFGTLYEIPPAIDIFVNVPFPTNVYTVYKFFLQDFGFLGTYVAMAVIGTVHGIIYKAAKQGSKFGIYFYAVTMYPMVMSFFDDTYYNFRAHIRDTMFILFAYIVVPGIVHVLSVISSKCKSRQYSEVVE